jgi:hypothetical protein
MFSIVDAIDKHTFYFDSSDKYYIENISSIPNFGDAIDGLQVLFKDFEQTKYCNVYMNDFKINLNGKTVNYFTGQCLFIYDAIYNPDIIEINKKYKRLVIPILYHTLCNSSYANMTINIKRKNINIYDKNFLHYSIKNNISQNMCNDILKKTSEIINIDNLDNNRVKEIIGIYHFFNEQKRLTLPKNIKSTITQYSSYVYDIQNYTDTFHLEINGIVKNIFFGIFQKGTSEMIDCLIDYKLTLNGTIFDEGNKEDAYYYNKLKNKDRPFINNKYPISIIKNGSYLNFSRINNKILKINFDKNIDLYNCELCILIETINKINYSNNNVYF